MTKVYCKNCKFFESEEGEVCHAPQNIRKKVPIKKTYFQPAHTITIKRYNTPAQLNRKNNCSFYQYRDGCGWSCGWFFGIIGFFMLFLFFISMVIKFFS